MAISSPKKTELKILTPVGILGYGFDKTTIPKEVGTRVQVRAATQAQANEVVNITRIHFVHAPYCGQPRLALHTVRYPHGPTIRVLHLPYHAGTKPFGTFPHQGTDTLGRCVARAAKWLVLFLLRHLWRLTTSAALPKRNANTFVA